MRLVRLACVCVMLGGLACREPRRPPEGGEAADAGGRVAASAQTRDANAASFPSSGGQTRSYWANNGGIVLELAYPTNHFRASNAVQAVRSPVMPP